MTTERYAVDSGWLVEVVNEHTCGTARDGYYGAHEPGCGMVPIARVDDLMREAITGQRMTALFAGGPDTPCRTTYPDGVESVVLPMADLRSAFDHTQPPPNPAQHVTEF